MSTRTSDYWYRLPDTLIAREPAVPRDRSRMMLLGRESGLVTHRFFDELPNLLGRDSLLVINNSRVIPARLPGRRSSGGKIDALLVREEKKGIWRCKVKNSARLRPGEPLEFCEGAISALFLEKREGGDCLLDFSGIEDIFSVLESVGFAPLPPYIHKVRSEPKERLSDLNDYQTIFARHYGAIAAPTAGLHFTPQVLESIRQKGIEILEITLHVGVGTFEPIRVDDAKDHQMHSERIAITQKTAEKINHAKQQGRTVVAVGTTVARTLEASWIRGELNAGERETDLFIYPPYTFQVVDQLLTNFHLPESTLLMLVSAFSRKEFILNAYQKAVTDNYRFFSFGDCMLIQ